MDELIVCLFIQTGSSNTVILRFISNGDKKVGFGFTVNFAINFRKLKICREEKKIIRFFSASV